MGPLFRVVLVLLLAGTAAGCFQPLYGTQSTAGGPVVSNALGAVDIEQIDAATGTDDARIGVELRNDLIFALQGGGGGGSVVPGPCANAGATAIAAIAAARTSCLHHFIGPPS